jgi:hypothetical protein
VRFVTENLAIVKDLMLQHSLLVVRAKLDDVSEQGLTTRFGALPACGARIA